MGDLPAYPVGQLARRSGGQFLSDKDNYDAQSVAKVPCLINVNQFQCITIHFTNIKSSRAGGASAHKKYL